MNNEYNNNFGNQVPNNNTVNNNVEPTQPVQSQPVYQQSIQPQPIYQQPVQPTVPVESVQPQQPKKSKLGIIILAVIVLAIAIVVIILLLGKGKSDSNSSSYSGEFGGTFVAPTSTDTHKGIVYLDPKDPSKKCTESEVNSNVNDNGTPTEIKSGCMKFYIYDDSGDNYKMILDHNTTVSVAWNSKSPAKEMNEVSTKLSEDTQGWVGNPRLITADEIAKITSVDKRTNVNWNSKKPIYRDRDGRSISDGNTYVSWFKLVTDPFNSHGYIVLQEVSLGREDYTYGWLYEYTYDCYEYGCNSEDNNSYSGRKVEEYWTSTATAGSDDLMAWVVTNNGKLSITGVAASSGDGVRPVIELPKSKINK